MRRNAEYACDHCGADTPDGAGHYTEDDDRICAECMEEVNAIVAGQAQKYLDNTSVRR